MSSIGLTNSGDLISTVDGISTVVYFKYTGTVDNWYSDNVGEMEFMSKLPLL